MPIRVLLLEDSCRTCLGVLAEGGLRFEARRNGIRTGVQREAGEDRLARLAPTVVRGPDLSENGRALFLLSFE